MNLHRMFGASPFLLYTDVLSEGCNVQPACIAVYTLLYTHSKKRFLAQTMFALFTVRFSYLL